jgi:prepilin-type processing-associated H-X9-DG protein
MNFYLDYNFTTGANFTAASTAISSFLCPSAIRSGGNGHDDVDPSDTFAVSKGVGYGMVDYGATCFTDINPTGNRVSIGTYPGTPFRDPKFLADGVFKHGSTAVSEIRDGMSNTMIIAEDAGRDARFVCEFAETVWDGISAPPSNRSVPQGLRRFWRWAAPANAIGVSGSPNNKTRPMFGTLYRTSVNTVEIGAGANDEIFAYHPGGANVLMGDGSVKFLKESINVTVLRGLVTYKGREVIGSDVF